MSKTATVVNVTNEPVTFEISTVAGAPTIKHTIPPQGSLDVAAGYAARLNPDGRDPQPSVIEKLTNKRVLPATDPVAKAILDAQAKKGKPEK